MAIEDTAFINMTELTKMDIKNNVVNITTMNTDEPHIDFSSSIMSFRVPRPNARQGTPRPLPRFSAGGEILNFLSNISTATEGASIEELLDMSENVMWSAASDGGEYVATSDASANISAFSPGSQGFASVMGDAQRSVAAMRGLSHTDSSSGMLPFPSALRSLMEAFGEGPHVNSILNRSLHDAAGYKFVSRTRDLPVWKTKNTRQRNAATIHVRSRELHSRKAMRSLSFLVDIVLIPKPSPGG